jgi:lipid-A-disaccharide synthase
MPLRPPCDLFVCAGEASGDAYAAAVVAELRRRIPDLEVAGMGGPQLAAAGAEVVQPIDGMAVMGLLPVLARLPTFIRIGRHVQAELRDRRPRVVLTVDYPGFNLRLQRSLQDLRRDGVRLVHLVAPQVWAWRRRRAKPIAGLLDRLLCFFPFEPGLFRRHGGRADFVGHPLIDLVAGGPAGAGDFALDDDRGNRLGADARLLLLAPGSREREVATILPVYHAAAEALLRRLRTRGGPPVQAVVSKVPDLPIDLYRRHTDLPLVEGRYRDLLAASHLAMIASGTATLEAAIIGTPHLIAYRTDRLTAAVGRRVLMVRHVGLPNLVAGRRVCPELLQEELSVPRLVAHAERLWDGPAREHQLAGLAEVRDRLGGGGALGRIADALVDELRRSRRAHTRITGMAP